MSRVLVFASIAALSICPEGMRRKGLARLERALCFGDIGMAPASRFRAITLIRKQRMSGLGHRSSTVSGQKSRFLPTHPSNHAGLRADFQKLLWWHVFSLRCLS